MAFPVFASGDILNASDMNAVGLWKVAGASFTTVGTVNVNNCFSSNYVNYRLIVKVSASSTTQTVTMRLRASGTDSSASYYFTGIASNVTADTTAYFPRSNNATAATVTVNQSTGTRSLVLDVMNPQLAENTYFHGNYTDFNAVLGYAVGGAHLVATAYDGFSLFAGAGGGATISGSYVVYGYRN